MIVPLRNDSGHALFSRLFSRLLKLTHLVSGQSIAAVMYDGGRGYFGIYKIVLLLDYFEIIRPSGFSPAFFTHTVGGR
jgi:hypothetical protein